MRQFVHLPEVIWILCLLRLLHQLDVSYQVCPELTVLTYLWLIRHTLLEVRWKAQADFVTPPSRVGEDRNCANFQCRELA